MDPRKLHTEFGLDERVGGECAYCGGSPDTADHTPSKVLLEDPLPDNLPVVAACAECNRGFSSDEEYLACFLECVLVGTVQPDRLRPKIQAALRHSPKLVREIASSVRPDSRGRRIWVPDYRRVERVMVKLARGHMLYELGAPRLEAPQSVTCIPFLSMSVEDRLAFERPGAGEIRGWPEIGSRAFLRACGGPPFADQCGPWIQVQRNRYRYAVDEGAVQMVLAEYLACAVRWD